jgi:uncharacterized membrane protein YccC
MTTVDSLRDLVWDGKLSADMSRRYYSYMADRYQRVDQWGKVIVAVFSSTSAIAGWTLWQTPGVSWIWALASGVAAVLAIALPIFDPAKSLKAALKLDIGWSAAFRDYELLWAQIEDLDEPKVLAALKDLRAGDEKLDELESGLAKNQGLADRVEAEVRDFYRKLAARNGG